MRNRLAHPNPAGGANLSTTYTYDVMNHLTGVSMTRSSTTQTRTFTYDPTTWRLSSQQQPESGTTSYTYNADGTVATKTDSKGQVTQWNYDTYQRVTSVQFFPTPGNEDTCQGWNLTYDVNPPNPPIQSTNALGRLTFFQWRGSCTEGAGSQYSYTPGGLVNAKSGPGTLTYTYDSEGKVTSYTTPSWGQYNYSFDLMDRPIGLTDLYSTEWMQGVQYGPSDQITQRTRRWFNGSTYVNMTETRQYNSLGQLIRITLPGVLDQEYDYSSIKNNGRITQTIDHIAGETVSYTYDSLNRLATATSSLGWGESYTYDGFGNLTDETVTAGSAPALHVTVDPTTNRLTGSAYTYDANGNLTAVAGAFTATYNVNNKLYTISPSSGGTQVYYYDQNGYRGLIADGSSNIIGGGFYGAYGEHESTGYLGSDSSASSDYIFFGTEPIWNSFVNSAGVTVYSEQVAQDRLGSVRLWGTQTTNLFPYGVEYTTTGQDHEKFATYIRDSFTGLDYARNRFYSSTLGRFTSADTTLSSVNLANPLSWNRYAYVSGDPVNRNDPSGLDCSYDEEGDEGDDGGGGDCTPGGGGGDVPLDPEPPSDPCAVNSMAPGCPTQAPLPDPCSGSLLLAAGCPAPPPVILPPQPPPQGPLPPTCTLTVYSRSLDRIGIRNIPINLHGYLDLTTPFGSYIFEGLHVGNLLQAGSDGGNNPGVDQNDGSINGPWVCGALPTLDTDETKINGANISYSGIGGPNSNSALRYMLQSLNIFSAPTSWYSIPFPMQVFGYWTLLPGLETAPVSTLPLQRVPRRFHLL